MLAGIVPILPTSYSTPVRLQSQGRMVQDHSRTERALLQDFPEDVSPLRVVSVSGWENDAGWPKLSFV